MNSRILSLLPLVVSIVGSQIAAQSELSLSIPDGSQPPGKLFVVKSTADSADATPGDGICADSAGNCTLRAAVDEANANQAPADVIIFDLAYPAVIELTLGELVLSDTATAIVGPGARRLTVRRQTSAPNAFRIFNVTNAEDRSVPRIWRLRIEGGQAPKGGFGGGIRVGAEASVDLREVWFADNAAANGGALLNEGTLDITRSLFVNNTATDGGGAFHLASGSVTVLTNSTLTSNSAATGGAIDAAGSLVSANNTITHNTATASASSIASAAGSSVSTLNTIIGSDNSLPITSISGEFLSLGNNIVTDARGSTGFSNGVNSDQVSENNSIDPMLGPLADNGGQTDTRALLNGSPAIDNGNSCVFEGQCAVTLPRLRWDQRTKYLRRTLAGGPVDVGAFESGTATSGGSGGIFAVPTAPRPRTTGFLFAIDVSTAERRAFVLRANGTYRLQNLPAGDVFVLDYHVKNRPRGPFVFAIQF